MARECMQAYLGLRLCLCCVFFLDPIGKKEFAHRNSILVGSQKNIFEGHLWPRLNFSSHLKQRPFSHQIAISFGEKRLKGTGEGLGGRGSKGGDDIGGKGQMGTLVLVLPRNIRQESENFSSRR